MPQEDPLDKFRIGATAAAVEEDPLDKFREGYGQAKPVGVLGMEKLGPLPSVGVGGPGTQLPPRDTPLLEQPGMRLAGRGAGGADFHTADKIRMSLNQAGRGASDVMVSPKSGASDMIEGLTDAAGQAAMPFLPSIVGAAPGMALKGAIGSVAGSHLASKANEAMGGNAEDQRFWGNAGSVIGSGLAGVSMPGRANAAAGAGVKGFGTITDQDGKLVHLGWLDRIMKGIHEGKSAWDMHDPPTVTPPGGHFPDGYHMGGPQVPPIEGPSGGWPQVQHAGPPTPPIESPPGGWPIAQFAEPWVPKTEGPQGGWPGQYPINGPQIPPIETPPGGAWPGQTAGPVQLPPIGGPSGGWTPPVVPGGTSIPGNKGDLVIPSRYNNRNNPSAAWNVDIRIATELKRLGVRPENITAEMISNAKSKLGHLRATPQLEHVRQTMIEGQ